MPKPESLKNKGNFSKAVYVDFNEDGSTSVSSTGILGVTYNPVENLSASLGAGYTTDFKKNTGLVLEGKATYSFNEYSSIQLRVRDSHTESVDATQVRISPSFKCNVAKKTTIYANPYLSTKIDYKNDKCSYDYGIFGGVTQGIGKNIKVSAEAQRYRNHWGMNVIASINF